MTPYRCALLIAALAIVTSCREEPLHAPGNEGLPASYVEYAGLLAPQGIVYDSIADVYLVSNAPNEADPPGGKGFISRIAPGGKVLDLQWISAERGVELLAPSGMAIRGDTLFVADRGCVRLFQRATGQPTGAVCVEGALSLSGIVASDSVIHVTDKSVGQNRIGIGVAVIDRQGHVRAVIRDSELENPVGVASGPWGTFVTTAGSDQVVQLTPDGPNPVIRGVGRDLGGIIATKTGSFAFSNATDSTVIIVQVSLQQGVGEIFTLARQLARPGHLGYDSRRDRILIPEAGRDRLVFVDISPGV